jgi:hypothetical protein
VWLSHWEAREWSGLIRASVAGLATVVASHGKSASENEAQRRGAAEQGRGKRGRAATHGEHPTTEGTRVSGCGTENTMSSESLILLPALFIDN